VISTNLVENANSSSNIDNPKQVNVSVSNTEIAQPNVNASVNIDIGVNEGSNNSQNISNNLEIQNANPDNTQQNQNNS
jgi:hypothetical protein